MGIELAEHIRLIPSDLIKREVKEAQLANNVRNFCN